MRDCGSAGIAPPHSLQKRANGSVGRGAKQFVHLQRFTFRTAAGTCYRGKMTVRKWGILYSLWFGMLRRPQRDYVDSVGRARCPQSRGCMVQCCMVRQSILKSAEADICI